MKVKTKVVKIDWDGKQEDVELKELTFGEYNDLMEEAAEVKLIGTTPQVKISHSKMKEFALLKAVTKAPFEKSIQAIRNLPRAIGDQLYAEVDKLNTIPAAKKET